MADRIGKCRALLNSLILSSCVLFMLFSALNAIEKGRIWDFLLCSGCVLTILLGPKDSEFFKTKISGLKDLNKLDFYTDPLTAAFLIMSQFMMVAGLLGIVLFGR